MKRLLLIAALFTAGLLAFAALYATKQRPAPPPAPSIHVPATYAQSRESAGHRSHLRSGTQCRNCHAFSEGFSSSGPELCSTCHIESTDRVHRMASLAGLVSCFSCHPFNRPGAKPKDACTQCHDKGNATAPEVKTHKETDCGLCHRPHQQPSLQTTDCSSCHAESTVSHGTQASPQTCLTCHSAHEPAGQARNCQKCHLEAEPRVSLRALFAGHDECQDCHRPHQPLNKRASCRDCHADKAQPSDPKEHSCESCHRPHNPKSAKTQCVNCHKQDILHAENPKDNTCVSCHPQHLKRPTPSSTCTKCHEVADRDVGTHGPELTCGDCHETHAFVWTGQAACANCHEDLVRTSTTGKHSTCNDCHTQAAHQPKIPTPTCESCHEDQLSQITVGHEDCSQCHQTHGPVRVAQSECADCHKEQSVSSHTRCADCHRPHGPNGVPKPPDCTTCHDTPKALHAVKEHSECRDCHGAHGKGEPKPRPMCLGCHEEQVKHEPTATSCVGCHPFAE